MENDQDGEKREEESDQSMYPVERSFSSFASGGKAMDVEIYTEILEIFMF